MVQGVVSPYSKDLLIEGVGFRAAVKGSEIDLELGYSHPVSHPIPDGVTVTVADNVKIHVEGADKQKVGQMAADIKSYYPVEPYKGKGVRILGQYVRRKEEEISLTALAYEFTKETSPCTKAKVEIRKRLLVQLTDTCCCMLYQ